MAVGESRIGEREPGVFLRGRLEPLEGLEVPSLTAQLQTLVVVTAAPAPSLDDGLKDVAVNSLTAAGDNARFSRTDAASRSIAPRQLGLAACLSP